MRVHTWTMLTLMLAIATLAPCLHAAEARAWLDRTSMQLGETVTLNVEVSGIGSAEPDVTPLQTDFDLLGTSSSSTVNIVNGQTTTRQLWAVGLQPKHAGRLAIPALKVGAASTQALELTVEAASTAASGHSGDEIFIEVAADPLMPYVQQQIRFSVKLYYAVNLAEGALDEPSLAGLVVQKLGQDRNYEAEQGGRRYRVLERRYALLPEKSGTVEIPSINFRGRALSGNDPGGMFFSRGRNVSARSQALSLDVKPRPAASGSGPWLPAQSLQLTGEGIDDTTGAKVGEPLTLTLNLRAQGLGFEQLPELELPHIDGAEVYPDKSTTRTRDDGSWLFGERSRKFAIVPLRAGKLQLPQIELDWWDTAQGRAQRASVPAREIEVAAAATAAAPVAPGAEPPLAVAQPAVASPTAIAETQGDAVASATGISLQRWRALAVVSLGLWLATMLVLVLRWRRLPLMRSRTVAAAAPSADLLGSRGAFQRSLGQSDAATTARALLRWARAEGFDVRNLGELAQQLRSPQQRAAIDHLQQACFAQGSSIPPPAELRNAFDSGLSRAMDSTEAAVPTDLAPLWPQSSQRRA